MKTDRKASDVVRATDSRAKLAGDGCLLTAATFAVLTSVGGGLVVLSGVSMAESATKPTPLAIVLQLVASLLLLATLVLGPVAAWLLHGRRIRAVAVLGAVLGAVAGAVVVQGIFLAAMLVGMAIGRVTGMELAGPVAVLSLVTIAFCTVVVWLDTDAVRDLSPTRREHRRLDIARIAATIIVALFSAAMIGVSVMNPRTEIGEAAIFALAAGVFGAVLVGVTDAVVNYADKRKAGKAGPDAV